MASIKCGHCKEVHAAVVEVARCAEHTRGGHIEYYHERCPQCATEKEVYEEGLAEARAHEFAADWAERMAHNEP